MDNVISPNTPAPCPAVVPIPRTLDREAMRRHEQQGEATPLSGRHRDQVFVKYDGKWWISGPDGFVEIIDVEQNRKLDRWQTRLTQGALCASRHRPPTA